MGAPLWLLPFYFHLFLPVLLRLLPPKRAVPWARQPDRHGKSTLLRRHWEWGHVGNTAKQCRLGLFQDTDFARDLEDSKSTSGGTLCNFGSHKFVPISWMCKKQTGVSHSSTESQITFLDTGLRLDRFACSRIVWDLINSVLGSVSQVSVRSGQPDNDVNKPRVSKEERVFFVARPNPMLHFAPFLSTHFFPCLNPMFKNGSFLSVCDTLKFESPPLRGKKIEFGTDSSSSLARIATIELPECQERRGAKTMQSVFF